MNTSITETLNGILAYLDDLRIDDRLLYDDYSALYDMISDVLQNVEKLEEEKE